MEYVSRTPEAPLGDFIDDIYCLTGVPRHRRLNVPPMPSAHLFLNLSGPVRLHDPESPRPPVTFTGGLFTGLRTRRFVVELSDPVRLVGVHFKPWGMSPFLEVPAAELRDQWVPMDAVWPGSAGSMGDRLAGTATPEAALELLEAELRGRLDPAPSRGLRLVQATAGRLESTWGAVSVGALTDRAGVSSNHLATQFKAHVGITPKRVARIYRFARLILSVDARRPVDWAELAHHAGYFDQAHLGREFKDFTGLQPSAYLALRRRFPADRDFPPDSGPMPVE